MTGAGWAIERTLGPAGTFHHRPPPSPLRPTVWVHRVDRPALVLGSTQRAELIDTARAERDGVEVCQRRSGGGLVLVDPDTSLWIDVFVPRGHHLWRDDVGLAFDWVGQTWATALEAARPGPPDTDLDLDIDLDITVHRGPMLRADWGRVICFAGIGPGEVLIGDRKVVGLSQRRTREVARFQGLAVNDLGAAALRRYLAPGALPSDLDAALDDLAVGAEVDPTTLERSFLAALPSS